MIDQIHRRYSLNMVVGFFFWGNVLTLLVDSVKTVGVVVA